MGATLRIINAAGAQIEEETIEIGESVYNRGISNGIEPGAWDSLRRTRVFLKAPITTPQGGGFKSLNVTVRKMLGLYANVRPCASLHPYVKTKHPNMDLVIVRENEEDVYGGIEHRQTQQVTQALKLISRPGSERVIRYAFEYAVQNNRKKVTCFTKDNILKMTDGLFHKVFDEIAAEYPQIENEHWIVDIGAAKMADTPEAFDVIVLPNLYGDVLSDVAAQITGSVGLAGSANIGDRMAMFEAIHGSAPRRAGQNMANPSALLLGAVMMLNHIGQSEVAQKVHNAWLKTMEDGVHTYDIYKEGTSKQKVGTREFADAVIERLGGDPVTLKAVRYNARATMDLHVRPAKTAQAKRLAGVDVFFDYNAESPAELAQAMTSLGAVGLPLQMISNRGTSVWPNGSPETFLSDHWTCRFLAGAPSGVTHQEIVELLSELTARKFDWIKTELLYEFDGKPGFSLAQGQ
ncbi:MAG: NADP-dependent isocitrate dehydrogenase [Candidatus Eremiobacteraeota bacterium]|nr:NADP-dependent isocitrate dehydrogenase [Candidatus Eremiobacteraeota bacterium]